MPSGSDLNGNGRLGDPADSFGYGKFRGQYAMALLSRFPISSEQSLEFTNDLWKDFGWANLPVTTAQKPFPSENAHNVMRLSSKGHWVVAINLPDGRTISILSSHPTPPVFDGPEDFNGKRNADEILFWNHWINENDTPFVLLGDLNSDPIDGDSLHAAITALLQNSKLQDPKPDSNGAVIASRSQGGLNNEHRGDPALDTTDWRDDPGPGNMRVDYVLPSSDLKVTGSGVFWPAPSEIGFEWIGSSTRVSSDHRLVWVDIE